MIKMVLPDIAGEKDMKHPSFVVPYFSTGGASVTASTGNSHETSFYKDEELSRSTIETPPMVYHDRRERPSFIE